MLRVEYQVVPNPTDKRYKSLRFRHPIHGFKTIGCLTIRELREGGRQEVFRSFALNCGSTIDNFDFIEREGE